MLSTDDVNKIEQLLDKKIEPLNARFDNVEEKVADLGERLEDKISDVYGSIFSLKAENSEDHRGIKRRLTEFREIFDEFTKHFDRSLQETRKEVDRVNRHLKLPPIS